MPCGCSSMQKHLAAKIPGGCSQSLRYHPQQNSKSCSWWGRIRRRHQIRSLMTRDLEYLLWLMQRTKLGFSATESIFPLRHSTVVLMPAVCRVRFPSRNLISIVCWSIRCMTRLCSAQLRDLSSGLGYLAFLISSPC